MAYDYSQYGGVLVARQDKVLTITLNSPETLNAFTGPMHNSMSRIWDDVNDDPDVHVVVPTYTRLALWPSAVRWAKLVRPCGTVNGRSTRSNERSQICYHSAHIII